MEIFIGDCVRSVRGKARPDGGLAMQTPYGLVSALIDAVEQRVCTDDVHAISELVRALTVASPCLSLLTNLANDFMDFYFKPIWQTHQRAIIELDGAGAKLDFEYKRHKQFEMIHMRAV